MLVVDNSPSMDFVTESGLTRKEIVIPAAKKLTEKLLENSNDLKIGIVKFNGGYTVSSASSLMCSLTNDKNKLLETLDKINEQATVGGTNILAGIKNANNNFDSKCKNKIIVLLTDGLPNYDLDYNKAPNDSTTSTSIEVQDNTKNGLLNISNSGTYIISMMTGMSESDGNTDKNGNVFNDGNLADDLIAVEKIFGTEEKPTVGKFYLVASANVDNIIRNDILNDVVEKIQKPIYNTKIVDYLSEDILKNFEILDVNNSSLLQGENVSFDIKDGKINWNIGTVKGEQAVTFKYKLKLKNMQNTELLNKTIAISEKTVLTYQDVDQKEYEVELTNNPKIQLVEVEQTVDDTIANDILPKAGARATIIGFIIVTILSIVIYKKYNSYKDIK